VARARKRREGDPRGHGPVHANERPRDRSGSLTSVRIIDNTAARRLIIERERGKEGSPCAQNKYLGRSSDTLCNVGCES